MKVNIKELYRKRSTITLSNRIKIDVVINIDHKIKSVEISLNPINCGDAEFLIKQIVKDSEEFKEFLEHEEKELKDGYKLLLKD